MSMRGFMLLLICVSVSSVSYSQERDTLRVGDIERLRQELQILQLELRHLRRGDSLSSAMDEELERLQERFELRMRGLENKIDAVARAGASTVFNPRTTVFINSALRIDDQPVTDTEQVARIDDRPFLRSAEVDLRASVDQYAEGVVVLAVEDEAGTGFEIDAEETYGLLKRLPIVETAPLGLKLKIGRYRAAIGVNNRLHLHDVPWTSRPLVVSKYLGTEHGDFFESGYNAVGVDLDFFIPSPIPGSTLEMNLDVLRAGELALSEGRGGSQPAYLSHLNWFKDWNNEHFLTVGISGYFERGLPRTRLLGLDLTYKWRPAERGSFRSFVAGGELLIGDHRFQEGLDVDGDGKTDVFPEVQRQPMGWFAYAQYQLSWWLYAGVRYDRVEEPQDPALRTQAWAGYLSYYTSEFLRFRVGFEHRESNLRGISPLKTVFFEVNLVFGSHPIEPYWVSR